MVLVDELKALQQLRDQGTLTEDEFTRAKGLVVGTTAVDLAGRQSVSTSELLAAIDKNWEIERKDYLFRDGRGRERVPTKGTAVGWAAFACGFGFLELLEAIVLRTSPATLIPGLGGLVIGFASVFTTYDRAHKYERAYAGYLQRRLEALLSDRLCAPSKPMPF